MLLNEIYRTAFTARSGFSEDVRRILVFINDSVDSVNSAPHLEVIDIEPHKLYMFAVHDAEFAEKCLATPTCYGQ